ncbi:MAG: hypothetical protein Q4C41_07695 [Eggerthellaceae bacterium]|nr:hypothetical protein [Eggerthellaceae bacterium]
MDVSPTTVDLKPVAQKYGFKSGVVGVFGSGIRLQRPKRSHFLKKSTYNAYFEAMIPEGWLENRRCRRIVVVRIASVACEWRMSRGVALGHGVLFNC